MNSFLQLLAFELKYYLRRMSTWVYFVIMAFLPLGLLLSREFPAAVASGRDGPLHQFGEIAPLQYGHGRLRGAAGFVVQVAGSWHDAPAGLVPEYAAER